MYPNQQHPGQQGGPNPPYPQQSQYNTGGVQQPRAPNNTAAGLIRGQQPNMSAPYGSNQGGYIGGQGAGGYGGNQPMGGYGGSQPAGSNTGGQGMGGYGGNQPTGSNTWGQGMGGYGGNQSTGSNTGGQGMGGYGGNQPMGGYGGSQPAGSNAGGQGMGGYGGNQPMGGYGGNRPTGSNAGGQGMGGYGGNRPMDAAGGPSQGFMPNDPRTQQLNQIAQRHQISSQLVQRLHMLASCEIVVVCDDSGSMRKSIQGTNRTRWDELKSIVNIVVEIGAILDSDGIDIYFLNRQPMLNVTNGQTIQNAFKTGPSGQTPLVPTLRKILAAKRNLPNHKKLLILIATDGAPTNEQGQVDIGALESVLRNERSPQTYVTFLACTDDLQALNYLTSWDKSIPNLDVLDDYQSELAEVQGVRGRNFPFSFGDYIVKALLGSLDSEFDLLDERA